MTLVCLAQTKKFLWRDKNFLKLEESLREMSITIIPIQIYEGGSPQ